MRDGMPQPVSTAFLTDWYGTAARTVFVPVFVFSYRDAFFLHPGFVTVQAGFQESEVM